MYVRKDLIIVRGAGDISTGTIHRLHRAGFPVLALETERPSAIRREVAFSEAVYDGQKEVEGITAVRIRKPQAAEEVWNEADAVLREAEEVWEAGRIPVLVDPAGSSIRELRPKVVIDAILAKKNTGTNRDMAPLTIALGPGFTAGEDVDYVIETMRGHDLGRIISRGPARPNTGIPGLIAGYGRERVIYAPEAGTFTASHKIGDTVRAEEPIGSVLLEAPESGSVLSKSRSVPVCTKIDGILRGVLRDGYLVRKGMKIADVDPRTEEYKNCFTISDKARCIAGSVLELVCGFTG